MRSRGGIGLSILGSLPLAVPDIERRELICSSPPKDSLFPFPSSLP